MPTTIVTQRDSSFDSTPPVLNHNSFYEHSRQNEGERKAEYAAASALLGRSTSRTASAHDRLKPIVFFAAFALLLLFSRCYKYLSASRVEERSTRRRLAGDGVHSDQDDDPDVAAIVELCLELEATSPDLMARPPPPQPVQQPHVTLPQQGMVRLAPGAQLQLVQSQSGTPSFSLVPVQPFPLPVSTLPQQPQQQIFTPLEHLLSSSAGSAVAIDPLSQQPHSSSFAAANWWSAFPPAHPTTTASSFHEGMGQGLETSSSATSQVLPSVPSQQVEISVGSKRGRPAASSPPPAKRTKGKVSSAKEHGGVAGHPSVDRGESQQPSGEASGLSPDSWLAPSSVSLPLHSPSYSSLYAPEGGESGPSRQQPDGGYAPQPQHTPPVQQDADASASARPAGVSVDNTLLSIILGYSGAAAPEDRTTTAAAASTASSGDGEGRVDAPGEGETSSPNLAHHRYYRLPSLMRGVRISPFALDSDPEYFIRRSQLMFTCLSTLRELFLKEKLDQKDAENVRCTAVRLALFMLRRQADPLDELSPIKLVSYMGRRYMMLDAIFSAVLVLGPSPEALENWRKFAKQIPTEVNLLSKIGYAAMSDAHMHMLYRLKIALNQLKNGVRPSARDTVELKRFLICDCSHSEFSKRSYLSWKLDDEAFEQGRTR